MLVNTSFNVRGEPIVCTPENGYRCFLGTKTEQSAMPDGRAWLREFELD